MKDALKTINQNNLESGLKCDEIKSIQKYYDLGLNEALVFSYAIMEDEISIHNNFFERIGLPKYNINLYLEELFILSLKGLLFPVFPFNHDSDKESKSLVKKDNFGNMIFRTNKSVLLNLYRDKYETDEFVNYILNVHRYLSVDDFFGFNNIITEKLSKYELIKQLKFGSLNRYQRWLLLEAIWNVLRGKTEFQIGRYEYFKLEGLSNVPGVANREKKEINDELLFKVDEELVKICCQNYPNLFLNELVPF